LFTSRSRVEPTERKPRAQNSYHAVSVRCGLESCKAVRALKDVRFLSADAPSLPLPQCDASHCECRYQHHDDRRAIDRRQYDAWGSGPKYVGAERRGSPGRRSTDR
jgi:hypothetical protein